MINDQERIKGILDTPSVERLKDFYEVGPVQRAAVDEFVELIIRDCVAAIMTSEQPALLDRREYFAAVVQYHFGIEETT